MAGFAQEESKYLHELSCFTACVEIRTRGLVPIKRKIVFEKNMKPKEI
jgi:hypothetical protein